MKIKRTVAVLLTALLMNTYTAAAVEVVADNTNGLTAVAFSETKYNDELQKMSEAEKEKVFDVVYPDNLPNDGSSKYVPKHLYQLKGNIYCAVYEYWVTEPKTGKYELKNSYVTIVSKASNGSWTVMNRYKADYSPLDSEIESLFAPSSWAQKEVSAAQEKGLVPKLTGNPLWQSSATRLQFAELTVNLVETILHGQLKPAPAATFNDCTENAVLKAYKAGIINGTSESTFSPDSTVTREQLATMLWRAIDYIQQKSGKNVLISGGKLSWYTDAAQVSSWAKDAMDLLATSGIIQGTSSSTISPKSTSTVEQSVLMVYRLYNKLSK